MISIFHPISPPNVRTSIYQKKHKAWKGERTGLYIRVPVEIANDLRNEAIQTQQHFNDVAINRLRKEGK